MNQSSRNNIVSVIVPAHNEEKTIRLTLDVAGQSDLVNEIIIVSDGSTDKTVEIARSYKNVNVIDCKNNNGKARAMQIGVDASQGDVIVFLDADLKGFRLDHLDSIIRPVKDGEVVMCVASRDKATPEKNYKYRVGYPMIAGERAMRRFVWDQVPKRYKRGYMIETALNCFCRFKGQLRGSVFCSGLGIISKKEKWEEERAKKLWRKMIFHLIIINFVLFINPLNFSRAIIYGKRIKHYKPWIFPELGA